MTNGASASTGVSPTKLPREGDSKRTIAIIVTVVLILAALATGFWLGKRSVGVQIQEVVRSITEDWELYESENHGFSFRYPREMRVAYTDGVYSLYKGEEVAMALRVQPSRVVAGQDPLIAIQISIPFDKHNFLVFSTSSSSNQKEIFYTIASTIMIGT